MKYGSDPLDPFPNQYKDIGVTTTAYRYYQLSIHEASDPTWKGTCKRFEVYDATGTNRLLNKPVIGGNFSNASTFEYNTLANTVNGIDTGVNGSHGTGWPSVLIVDAEDAFIPVYILHSSQAAGQSRSLVWDVHASNNADMSNSVQIFAYSNNAAITDYAALYQTPINSTAVGAPAGGYCDVVGATKISKVACAYRIKITGYEDAVSPWHDIKEMEMLDADGNNLVRHEDGAWIAKANYIYANGFGPRAANDGTRLAGVLNSQPFWYMNTNSAVRFLEFFSNPTTTPDAPVCQYNIYSKLWDRFHPTDWILQCSHNSADWVDIHEVENASFHEWSEDPTGNTHIGIFTQ